MRLLIVNNRLDPVAGGGTARKAATLARALGAHGWDVALSAFDVGLQSDAAREALAGLTVHRVPFIVHRFPVPTVSPRTVRGHVAWADVVVLTNHWTSINVAYAAACRSVRRPYVVMPCGALEVIGRSARSKRMYNRLAGQRIVREASGWIATTPDEVASFMAYGVPAGSVDVIPNAIDADEAAGVDPGRARAQHGLLGRFVLFLGRLASVKGPDLLLEAWARLPPRQDTELVLAGPEGDAAGLVRTWLATHGRATGARWVGPLDRLAALDACTAAHVLVVPSRHEAMSLVALEAALSGCPVIATTTCGFPELGEHGGLVVDPQPAALAEAMAMSLAWSPDERTRRGDRLRDYVRTRHTWDAVTPRYEAVLRVAIDRKTSS